LAGDKVLLFGLVMGKEIISAVPPSMPPRNDDDAEVSPNSSNVWIGSGSSSLKVLVD
jgi:hypothetical protein